MQIPEALAAHLYRKGNAARWALPEEAFVSALQASADRALETGATSSRAVEQYLASLHLEDLALACACAAGNEGAWEHFVREHRPVLYRAADAIDPGSAREIADSLYADLYGTELRDGRRQSLFRYFHGRSSLATWLRAILAQRHVDVVRARQRIEPLPEVDRSLAAVGAVTDPDPDRSRYMDLIQRALAVAIAALTPRDRLRLESYYTHQLTLAQTGQVLGEHEATVSRQLNRTRRAIREYVERYLTREAGLHDEQVSRCFECALEDPGALDLADLIRKEP